MKRRFLVNAGAMLALGFMQRALGLVATAGVARLIGDRGLGTFAFVQSSSQTFYALSRLGAEAGAMIGFAQLDLPRERTRAEALVGETLFLFLVIAGLGFGVMVLGKVWITDHLFGQPDLAPFMFAAAALFFFFTLSQYCYVVFAGLQMFGLYARLTAFTALLMLPAVAGGAWEFGIPGAVWGLVVSQVVTFGALAVALIQELRRRDIAIRPRWPATQAKAVLALGLPFYLGGLFVVPVEFVALGLITRLFGVEALGDVRVSLSMLAIAALIPHALAHPMVSHIAAQQGGGMQAQFEATLAHFKFNWILALASTIVLAAIWPFAVRLIFGSGFEAARTVGQVALAAFIPTVLLSVLTSALLAMRRSKALLWVGALQAGLQLLCLWLLVRPYGLAGFFSAQAIALAVSALIYGWVLGRQYGVSIWRPWMLPLVLLTVGIIGLLYADIEIQEDSWVRLAASIAALALLTGVVAFRVLTKQEYALALAEGRAGGGYVMRYAGKLRRGRAPE